jgi:hypothetical protein
LIFESASSGELLLLNIVGSYPDLFQKTTLASPMKPWMELAPYSSFWCDRSQTKSDTPGAIKTVGLKQRFSAVRKSTLLCPILLPGDKDIKSRAVLVDIVEIPIAVPFTAIFKIHGCVFAIEGR